MTDDIEKLYEKLIAIVGQRRVKVDKVERLLYSHDLAPLPKEAGLAFKLTPDAVVLPQSAVEVSEIVKLACAEHIPIVPRGAATWGFGGAVPCQGGIVLDMSFMNSVLRVDTDNMEVEVEAGCVWKKIYDMALQKGLFIGSYPSSILSATVAGWINTGGIGIGTYKYGSVGRNLRNMEVVLPEGQIIQTGFNNVADNSSGYNLNQLFVGSEGTLGVITRVAMQAHPAPEILKPISIRYPNLFDAFPFLETLSRNNIQPLHIALVDEKHFSFLEQMGKPTHGEGAMINIALEGTAQSVQYEESVIEGMIKQTNGVRLPDAVATHEWDERMYEFRAREVGVGSALGEIVVPLSRFPQTAEDIYELIDNMSMEASIIGMLVDRSTVALLPYFLFNDKKLITSLTSLAFPKKLGDVALKNGGRPLGFGLFFAPNLPKIRGEGADVMFNIKSVLDPHDIMNPGKLLEGLTRFGAPVPAFAMNLGMDAMALLKYASPKDDAFEKKAKEFREKKEQD